MKAAASNAIADTAPSQVHSTASRWSSGSVDLDSTTLPRRTVPESLVTGINTVCRSAAVSIRVAGAGALALSSGPA